MREARQKRKTSDKQTTDKRQTRDRQEIDKRQTSEREVKTKSIYNRNKHDRQARKNQQISEKTKSGSNGLEEVIKAKGNKNQ